MPEQIKAQNTLPVPHSSTAIKAKRICNNGHKLKSAESHPSPAIHVALSAVYDAELAFADLSVQHQVVPPYFPSTELRVHVTVSPKDVHLFYLTIVAAIQK